MRAQATGVGSHPGADQDAFDEALRVVLGEVPELPYLPEVPGRGAAAAMAGRAVALLSGLGADLQPAGWRLTSGQGADQRRAISLLGQDLDTLEAECADYTGPMKVQVCGPWTLAASVERPRGDRVLGDHGATRDLAQSLAEGLRDHLADLRRRVGGGPLVLQIDEPALPAILAGQVPTASGLHRHRSVGLSRAAEALEWVLEVVAKAGAEAVLHCCAADVPWPLLARVGAHGVSVDLDQLDVTAYDAMAGALESGQRVFLGVVPALAPAQPRDVGAVVERVQRVVDMLGIESAERLVLTPACGLAGADARWARQALELCRRAAERC